MSDAPIVTFGIPLLGQSAAVDWGRVVHHFNATLGSIFNQTDPHFRVIVACTDLPPVYVPIDGRIGFLRRPQLDTHDYVGLNSDGGIKRYAIAERFRELGGGYLMFVDADDLISNVLVEFARRENHRFGYLVTDGYLLDAESGALSPFPLPDMKDRTFDRISATSSLVRLTPDELPGGASAQVFDAIFGKGHNYVGANSITVERPLMDVPFRAVVYVKNTGNNLSNRPTADNPYLAWAINITERAYPLAIRVTPSLAHEFNYSAACFDARQKFSLPTIEQIGISVAVCTHRRPQGLRRLLTALAPQARGRTGREIIVVNDGTHDADYAAVVAEFADMITYLPSERNEGTAVARNRSAARARHAFIAFTDDDCEPPSWWLDWVEARLRRHPELDAIGGTTTPMPRQGRTKFWDRVQVHHQLLPRPHQNTNEYIFVTACFCVRRELFMRLGGFLEHPDFTSAGEDTELSVRLQRVGARVTADRHWHVAHELGTLREYWRRYWRYGYINTKSTQLFTVAKVLESHRHARRRAHLRHAMDNFRREATTAQTFSQSFIVNVLSAAAATIVRIAYYDGSASAAEELRKAELNAATGASASKIG